MSKVRGNPSYDIPPDTAGEIAYLRQLGRMKRAKDRWRGMTDRSKAEGRDYKFPFRQWHDIASDIRGMQRSRVIQLGHRLFAKGALAVEYSHPRHPGEKDIVSRVPQPGRRSEWRVTNIWSDGRPGGHIETKTLLEALREVRTGMRPTQAAFPTEQPEMDNPRFIEQKEYAAARERHYGTGHVTNQDRPMAPLAYPEGTVMLTDKGIHGREYAQLARIPVASLYLHEMHYGRGQNELHPTKQAHAEQYAEWIRAGHAPPPIDVLEMENGRLKVMDGHRRAAAAKMAGLDTLLAWVHPAMPHPEGLDMKVGATLEHAPPGETWSNPMDRVEQKKATSWLKGQKPLKRLTRASIGDTGAYLRVTWGVAKRTGRSAFFVMGDSYGHPVPVWSETSLDDAVRTAARSHLPEVLGVEVTPAGKVFSVSWVREERSNPVDRLPGGLGDHTPVSAVSPRQLLKGIKVEMEHTKDPRIAREIALDHLTELPDYYDRLATIEPAHNPPGGKTMSLKEVEKWVPEAVKRGVSKVARSGRGFVTALRRAGSVGKLPEQWKNKRKAFIARHMAQAGNETLWQGGKPSGRALALMMWAYKPARNNPVSRSNEACRGYGRRTMRNPIDPFAETAVMSRPKKGTAAYRRKQVKVGDTGETVTVTMDLNHVAVPEMLAGKRYRSIDSARKAFEALTNWRRVAGFVARNGL